jgi:hypothetical protein
MKEDYLWDKSGKDPEIEKLENALAVFRYKETKPPALPANVLPFRKETKDVSTATTTARKFFSIPMTIAASIALVAFISGLWLFVSNRQEQIGNSMAQNSLERGSDIPWEIEPVPVKKEKVIKKTRHSSPKPKRETEVILTDEERYAYEQLMKALKITSEKLNYVKQKTQGEEETKSKQGSGSD